MLGASGSDISMPKYTLCYFNFRARAELARLLFALAGVEYEDERQVPQEWMSKKPTTPFGQLPVMYIDGVQIAQSHTIARYLARQFGYAGKTYLDQARADMVVDCVDDMLRPIMPAYREKSEQKKAQMRQNYEKELPVFMEMMEKLLTSNQESDEYFVGNDVTWADVAVMNAWYWIPGFGVTPPLDNFPKLKAHKERVECIPRIADWIDRRPDTPV